MNFPKTIRLTLALAAVFLFAPLAVSALEVRQEFNPNILIEDRFFNDTKTLGGAAGVQRFLESKGSILADTSPSFLTRLNEPTDPNLKRALDDSGWSLGRQRTAAELIWDAAQTSGINPQVILVTLNKEQGLITTTSCPDATRLQRMLNRAMGFDCPDGSSCGNLFPGFYYQLFGNLDTDGNRYLGATKSLMKSFATPGGRGPSVSGVPARIGQQVTLDNTLGDYWGISSRQIVTIGNAATAALYRYTPHVFNGNYNFWKFFTSWFKFQNGTLVSSTADGLTYIIQDGQLRRIPNFVAITRQISTTGATMMSPNELSDYPIGLPYGPADGTVIVSGDKIFAFQDGIMHPVSSFVLQQRQLATQPPLTVAASEIAPFTPGSWLTPPDGMVLRGVSSPDVYLVEDAVLKKYSPFTFRQRNAAQRLLVIADTEIALYAKRGHVAPLSGTLVKAKSSDSTYIMGEGRRLPLTAELFENRGFRTMDIVTLDDDEIASVPVGPPATPNERTFFAIGDSTELFIFKSGAKHPIFPFVARQRGITPDYRFEASIVSSWPDGIAIPPRDGTLIKSDASDAVFLVKNGQLRQLTPTLLKLLGLGAKKIVTLPNHEVTAFAKSGFAEPPENTYFQVAPTGEIYLFRQGARHRIYPFVAKQRGMTPDYNFDAAIANDWNLDAPIPPRDGTLVKSDAAATVYLVSLGKFRPLTDAAFKRRGYSLKNVRIIAPADFDAFTKGTLLK